MNKVDDHYEGLVDSLGYLQREHPVAKLADELELVCARNRLDTGDDRDAAGEGCASQQRLAVSFEDRAPILEDIADGKVPKASVTDRLRAIEMMASSDSGRRSPWKTSATGFREPLTSRVKCFDVIWSRRYCQGCGTNGRRSGRASAHAPTARDRGNVVSSVIAEDDCCGVRHQA